MLLIQHEIDRIARGQYGSHSFFRLVRGQFPDAGLRQSCLSFRGLGGGLSHCNEFLTVVWRCFRTLYLDKRIGCFFDGLFVGCREAPVVDGDREMTSFGRPADVADPLPDRVACELANAKLPDYRPLSPLPDCYAVTAERFLWTLGDLPHRLDLVDPHRYAVVPDHDAALNMIAWNVDVTACGERIEPVGDKFFDGFVR